MSFSCENSTTPDPSLRTSVYKTLPASRIISFRSCTRACRCKKAGMSTWHRKNSPRVKEKSLREELACHDPERGIPETVRRYWERARDTPSLRPPWAISTLLRAKSVEGGGIKWICSENKLYNSVSRSCTFSLEGSKISLFPPSLQSFPFLLNLVLLLTGGDCHRIRTHHGRAQHRLHRVHLQTARKRTPSWCETLLWLTHPLRVHTCRTNPQALAGAHRQVNCRRRLWFGTCCMWRVRSR